MRKSIKPIVVGLAVMMALAMAWPTAASALQSSMGFNQQWYVLGPYYLKYGNDRSETNARMDFMTDGTFNDYRYIPSTGTVVNTAYLLPGCGSFSFVYRCLSNGYSVPTIFRYTSPDDTIDIRGDTATRFLLSQSVFCQGADYGVPNLFVSSADHPQGNQRLDYAMAYFWAYANNLTGAPMSARFGSSWDDRIIIYLNGTQVYTNGTGGSGAPGNPNRVYSASGNYTFNPGLNLVMVKVLNSTGGYGFRVRLQSNSTTGNPITGGVIPETSIRWETMQEAQAVGAGFAFPPILPPAVPANQATGVRDFKLRESYTPNVATQVNLTVTTSSGHPDPVIVREFPPTGWTASIVGTPTLGTASVVTTNTIGPSGTTADGYTGPMIKWDIGPMTLATTNVARLTYMATPPLLATGPAYCTGTVTSDAQRVLGRGQTNGQTGAANQFNPPAPTLGVFDWAGDVGITIMGFAKQRWTPTSYGYGRPAIPPLTSGTRITGDPRSLGKASFAAGVYTITAAGHDVWDNNDGFFGVFKRQTGNFIISADVRYTSAVGPPALMPGSTRTTGASEWCKAGLMARYSTQGGSPNVLTGIRRYWNNTVTTSAFPNSGGANPQAQDFGQWRDVQWAGCGSLGEVWTTSKTLAGMGSSAPSAPASIKLTRRGSTFDFFHFYQGRWQRAAAGGVHTNPGLTTSTLYVGMAVTSHYAGNNDNLTDAETSVTAEFSNVNIVSGIPLEAATRTFSAATYSSLPLTVSIFLKNGGGTGNLNVIEYAPTSWTISSISHGGVADPRGTTITWTLTSFSADTTLTYVALPPQLGVIPNTWPVAPQFFLSVIGQSAIINDTTNLVDLPIAGPNIMLGLRVNLFQQGRYPDASYTGTGDTHIVQYRSQARYTNWGGPDTAVGINMGWNGSLDEGNNHMNSNTLIENRNDDKDMLVKFELPGMDAGYTVFGAALLLNLNSIRIQPPASAMTTSSVHRIFAAKVNKPWNEGRGTGSDGPFVNLGEVCWAWNQAFLSQWASWGLRGGALDCDMPESFVDCSLATVGKWNVWDVSRMATLWVKSPVTNMGVKLSQDDQNTTHYPQWATWPYSMFAGGIFNFASKEGTAAVRPMLAIVAYKPSFLAASHWELYR